MSSGNLKTRLADLTLELCQIPSVTGEEKALCDKLEPVLDRMAPGRVHRIGHSLVFGRLDDPRPAVLLAGHLDTVPPHPGEAAARVERDRVVGLGASDMKSGVAVILALLEDLDPGRIGYNLTAVLYEREEGPYAENGLEPVLAAVPELERTRLAFCLESTDLEVQVGCVGSLQARVTFRGKSSHSARPWQGENAIHKAGPLLAELLSRKRRRVEVEGFEFFEVLSATLASGGRARNVVPERFDLNLNYRFAPQKSLDQAEQEVRDLVCGRADVEIVDRSPAGPVCAANPLLKRFRQVTGTTASSKQAWTDVARLGVHGIDAVNFGPGLTSQAHQAGEFVPIENLERAYLALRSFIESPP
jgi:succinyl-diaminopimelate desuccinylase